MNRIGSATAGVLLALGLALAGAQAAGTAPQGARMFNDTTWQELQPYAAADRLIAVIRCEAIQTLSPGSRSERQQIRGSMQAGPEGMPRDAEVLLSRYAQGAPLMRVGSTYLIAAHRESAGGPWVLIEHREVRPDAAAGEWKAATAEASRRLGTR